MPARSRERRWPVARGVGDWGRRHGPPPACMHAASQAVTCTRMHARCHSRHRVANELACGQLVPHVRAHAAGLCPVVCARRVGSPARTSACMREDICVFARACDGMKHDILMLFVAENMGPGGEAPYDPRLFRSLSSTNPSWPPALPAAHNQVRSQFSSRQLRSHLGPPVVRDALKSVTSLPEHELS